MRALKARGDSKLTEKIWREEIKENGHWFTAFLLKLENAIMAFFDEGGNTKLGTLAIALPQRSGQTYISSVLLGERNMITTKILAEHFSKAFNCIALVSTHLAEITEGRITTTLLKLTQKLIEKTESKQHFDEL